MARNMRTEVMERMSATREAMTNMLKAGSFCRAGVPLSDTPPGMVADAANATVATSAATKEHDSEVLVNQLLSSTTNSRWVSLNIALAVLCSLLYVGKK